jgi:mono/diheme cytochrome c family protein
MKLDQYVSPAEWKRLLSSLLVVAIFIALFAIFAFVVVPGLRNANKPSTSDSLNPPAGEWGWLDPTEFPAEKGRVVPPIDPSTVLTPNPELLARGNALYLETCASCHGPKGEGDGPAGLGLATKPRHFTKNDGWKNGTRITDIYRTLEEGIKGSPMVSYNDLSRKDRMALVHVVRAFGAFEHGAEDPKALDALAKSFASSGEVIPNRIPVSAAIEKLIQEFKLVPPLTRPDLPQDSLIDPSRASLVLTELPKGTDTLFINQLTAGIPGNGFATRVALYPPETWKVLTSALEERHPK